MSDPALNPESTETPTQRTRRLVEKSLRRRHRSEWLFRAYGICAVLLGLSFVGFLFSSIISTGWTIFQQSYIQLDLEYSAEVVNPDGCDDP